MTVTTTNLIQGPATLYHGAFGVTEPADIDTAPGVGWTDCGATDGGIMVSVNDTYSALIVDQVPMEVERRRTLRVVTLKTVLAEATLENLARALANTAPSSGLFELDDDLDAFNPDYSALLLDGIAPAGLRRRFIVRKCLPTEAVETAYKKDGKAMFPVTWHGHWVSSAIKPFDIDDEQPE